MRLEGLGFRVTLVAFSPDGTLLALRSWRVKPGFNYLLLPKDREDSQIVDDLKPADSEITVLKTTDSALSACWWTRSSDLYPIDC